jgi:hypothetical protein
VSQPINKDGTLGPVKVAEFDLTEGTSA